MTESHVTLRIPKKALIAVLVLLLPAAFGAGMALGGRDGGVVDTTTSTVDATTTTVVQTTTTLAPATTVKAAARATTTTVAKKKAPVAPVVRAKPTVTVTYSDNCPAPGVNNRVAGTMIISWTTTNSTSVAAKVSHGADSVYNENNLPPNGEIRMNRTCNNLKSANGTYPGTPLTVSFTVTAYAADGTTAGFVGEDKM